MSVRSCVHPSGQFVYGLHLPAYQVANLRENDFVEPLGVFPDNKPYLNQNNFPAGDLQVDQEAAIYEIVNPFPFRGVTFINSAWANSKAANPAAIKLPEPPAVSMCQTLQGLLPAGAVQDRQKIFAALPETVLLALAATSTDPDDLVTLAAMSCALILDDSGNPVGLGYAEEKNGLARARIIWPDLFEVVVNNSYLPLAYRKVMVLRPGVQGGSEIVGEYRNQLQDCHVFEYLRRNSYIPWGHYAANMADDAVRYRMEDLSGADMQGLRHLYYQRTFLRLAAELGLPLPSGRKTLSQDALEELRLAVLQALDREDAPPLSFDATLWGWNYGFAFDPSGYRLHASHQQIHQQFAMLPQTVSAWHHGGQAVNEPVASYACGDFIAEFCERYHQETGCDFFRTYLKVIRNNRRMDGRESENTSLIVYEDEAVMLFVPKAQTSQWELQIMPVGEVGNILEADTVTRASLDRALLVAQMILARLGARLVSSIEYSSRIAAAPGGQRLLYALLPKLPYSMGAFSEAQLRWVNGHFPEDFAAACRLQLPMVLAGLAR
ncbi:MAG TPA: hypothetical protein DEQ20_03210 [Desulfobulbaceae bacterium]|nr:MAG: hypothetical protein A2520_07645 [Deltaproteobacteria bacterium RIFOXYD12_FULL_53_23]HCC53922.1 hypothetical protein [Desulfobulbaceae bacterium]